MLLPLWHMEWPLGQLFVFVYCIFHFLFVFSSLFIYLYFILFYFIFSSELLNRTSCHICGRWFLPTFLFRNGLLTLMYIDSFMNLMRFFSSLPNILNLSSVVLWPVMLKWSNSGEGVFRCYLNLSPNVLEDSPMYSSLHSTLPQLYLYMMPLFLVIWSLYVGATWRSLMVLPPLKYTWIPYFLHTFL